MEPKSGSRTMKKSASGGAIGERRKAKQKKRKDKKKLSLKGTESTDVPSPELDSEVPLDADATFTDQDGLTTPVVGQVTRLPHLNSHSSVSLTTSTPPPRLVTTATSRHAGLGAGGVGGGGTSSAPLTRSSLHPTPPPSSVKPPPSSSTTLLTVPPANLDGVVARVASLNIKQRAATKTRTKGQTSKCSSSGAGKVTRGLKERSGQNNSNKASSSSKTQAAGKGGSGGGSNPSGLNPNESLRWELALEDAEQEKDRLAVYKMNRRKRYLAAAQAKGLGWALNYNTSTTSTSNSHMTSSNTPLSEDSGVETATCGSPGTTSSKNPTSTPTTNSSAAGAAGAYIDFSSMQALRPMAPAHRALQEAFVEC